MKKLTPEQKLLKKCKSLLIDFTCTYDLSEHPRAVSKLVKEINDNLGIKNKEEDEDEDSEG